MPAPGNGSTAGPLRVVPPERIRNVALVGHSGVGKTTLAEAVLHCAGVVTRPGRVEDGSTVCDTDPEEIRRQTSLGLALAAFEHRGRTAEGEEATFKFNLLVAPGEADLVGEVVTALAACDLAVFVVSAVEGVEVQTTVAWRLAAEAGVPRMVFINKLDRERAEFDRTLAGLQDAFGAGIAPLELPIGIEAGFEGIADLLTDTAHRYADGVPTEGAIPDEMEAQEHAVRDALIEGIVVGDDALLERYLDGDIPSLPELEAVLAAGVASASVFPVVCGSATGEVGIDRLVELLCEIGPSPADRPPVTVEAGDSLVEVRCDPAAEPLAVALRTVTDPYVGRITLLRVLSGTIRPDDHLVNPRTGADERLHHLFTLRGKDHVDVSEAGAGDLVAVGKLTTVATGDTLSPSSMPVTVPVPAPPDPVFAVAIRPRSQGDDDKLATALHRLLEEDSGLSVERRDETHQTLLWGQGETHISVALERLARRFGVEVEVDEIEVPFRETVAGTARFEGKHKKQSGGHGQFAIATVSVEPLPRGAGFEFVDSVVGGAIPRQYIPAVERGVLEGMQAGGPHGHPIVDIRVTCEDGKSHAVDSSEMAFKIAGAIALRGAFEAAGSVVLEPISLVEVEVPDDLLGDVLGDLSARRGKVQGTESLGGPDHLVTALVPEEELRRYAVDLRALSSGRARFRASAAGHDVAPAPARA
ncbi:MAG: elongation factor G [Acidimicrobiales bacterium]